MYGNQEPVIPFPLATQINEIQLETKNYVANTPIYWDIPKVGYLAAIGANVEVNVTTGATGVYANSTTRTKVGGVTPYSAINRIRLVNNSANEIYSTTWWGNYLWNRTLRDGFDYRNIPTSFGAETDLIYNLAAGSVAATAYTYRAPIWIPIAYNPSLQGGLLLMQNDYTRYTLEVQWGDVAANLLGLSGTAPALTLGTIAVTPWVRYFNVPASAKSQPDISRVHQIREITQDITGTGDLVYRPQIGPTYLKMIHELVNNGAGLGASSVNTISLLYSASQRPLNLTPRQAGFRHYDWYGMAMPQGVYVHDFAQGSGITRYADERDFVDTSEITDWAAIYNLIPSLTLSGGYIRSIEEIFTPAT